MMLGALLLAFYGGTKYEAWREDERAIEVVDTLTPLENDTPIEEEKPAFLSMSPGRWSIPVSMSCTAVSA